MSIKSFTIYSTPTCHYCHLLKDWLTEKGIAFEDKDTSKDIQARQELVEKSHGMSVPVSVIVMEDGKETVILGFDQPRISSLLGIDA